MKPLIEVENLSKKFLISHLTKRTNTLKEAFSEKVKSWVGLSANKKSIEEFWALKEISFSVFPGDRIGIIGHNGAGKSTLLKIISRILPPSAGSIRLQGRVASLLEVGTGFHPDLSGKENIYLNGTILGMTEREINQRFDEIVSFAGVEKFLDTPVKKYSSGMFARLGFSIAAHLDPDIFIVDEVLSVGDIQFQEKCLKKLDKLSAEGRTILFVSHNIGAVLSLCNKGLYLKEGRIAAQGPIDECVNTYMQQVRNPQMEWKGECGDSSIIMRRFAVESKDRREYVRQGESLTICFEFDVLQHSPGLILGFDIRNQHNHTLASARSTDHPTLYQKLENCGKHSLQFTLDTTHLRYGEYDLSAFCVIHNDRIIALDPVTIHLSVYPSAEDLRFLHPHRCEGIFLGNQWELSHG